MLDMTNVTINYLLWKI